MRGLILSSLHKAYKLGVSPLFGNACRFHPSCSDYAREAIEKRGWFSGVWLAIKRLAKCHPWNPGGVDPVP
jgi:putative membrane protein insertion efficiency factor